METDQQPSAPTRIDVPEINASDEAWQPDNRFDRVFLTIGLVMGGIAGLGFLVLMFVNVFDVGLRNFAERGIGGSVELTEVVVAGLVYLGMASAEVSGTHVRTPMVTNILPGRIANEVRTLALTISTIFMGWMTIETFQSAIASFLTDEHRFALISVPIWPSRFAITLGLVVFTVVLAAEAAKTFLRIIRNESSLKHEFEGMP